MLNAESKIIELSALASQTTLGIRLKSATNPDAGEILNVPFLRLVLANSARILVYIKNVEPMLSVRQRLICQLAHVREATLVIRIEKDAIDPSVQLMMTVPPL